MENSKRARIMALIGVIFAVGLLVTGCTGWGSQPKRPAVGDVTGQVTDADGTPLVGLEVMTDTDQLTVTDAEGRFILTNVPIGPRTLFIDYFTAPEDAAPITQSLAAFDQSTGSFHLDTLAVSWENILRLEPQTEVRPAVHTAMLNVVPGLNTHNVVIPDYRHVDALHMYQATPALGTTLSAGARIGLQYSFTYALSSAADGAIGILVYYDGPNGEVYIAQPPLQRIERGTGQVVITIEDATVPDAPHVTVYAALVTSSGTRAVQSVAPYPIQPRRVPYAPELRLVGYNDQGVVLGVGPGNPENFKAYQLRRNTTDKFSGSSLVQTTTDPNVAFIHDVPPRETTYYYWLVMETDDGRQSTASNRVKVAISNSGVYRVPVDFEKPLQAIIADPVRDRLYATVPKHNLVQVLSTVTPPNMPGVEAEIPVGARPDQLAITSDGRWLFVTNPGNHSLTRIDLATFDTHHVPNVGPVGGIAVHPTSSLLYVGLNEPGNRQVIVYDTDTMTVLQRQAVPTAIPEIIAVDGSGSYMYVGRKQQGAVDVMDATTLSPVTNLENLSLEYHVLPRASTTAFIGQNAVDTADWYVSEKLNMLPIVFDDETEVMAVIADEIWGRPFQWSRSLLYMLEPSLSAPALRIDLRLNDRLIHGGASFALSRDKKRLYVATGERNTPLAYIDLVERSMFGTL